MNKVPDRTKMRRAYLLKKGTSYSLLFGSGVLAFCGFGFALFVAGLAILLVGIQGTHVGDGSTPLSEMEILGWATPLFLLGLAAGLICLFLNRSTKEKLKALSHVPPVNQQVSTLRADEVLLRGSQASPASPEELLRAAGSEETKAEELLRATSGGAAK